MSCLAFGDVLYIAAAVVVIWSWVIAAGALAFYLAVGRDRE